MATEPCTDPPKQRGKGMHTYRAGNLARAALCQASCNHPCTALHTLPPCVHHQHVPHVCFHPVILICAGKNMNRFVLHRHVPWVDLVGLPSFRGMRCYVSGQGCSKCSSLGFTPPVGSGFYPRPYPTPLLTKSPLVPPESHRANRGASASFICSQVSHASYSH